MLCQLRSPSFQLNLGDWKPKLSQRVWRPHRKSKVTSSSLKQERPEMLIIHTYLIWKLHRRDSSLTKNGQRDCLGYPKTHSSENT